MADRSASHAETRRRSIAQDWEPSSPFGSELPQRQFWRSKAITLLRRNRCVAHPESRFAASFNAAFLALALPQRSAATAQSHSVSVAELESCEYRQRGLAVSGEPIARLHLVRVRRLHSTGPRRATPLSPTTSAVFKTPLRRAGLNYAPALPRLCTAGDIHAVNAGLGVGGTNDHEECEFAVANRDQRSVWHGRLSRCQ